VPHFLSPAQKVAGVEASTEMLRILHESEENLFEGATTGHKSWSQYSYPSSEIFARSPTSVIPRTRQAVGTKQTMIAIFFTGYKLIVLDTLPKGAKFNQPNFVDYIFLDLKREHVNLHCWIPQATLWVHMDNSISQNESEVASQSEKHLVSRLQYPLYSRNISHCDFWPFEMLKGVLKNHEFNSSDGVEEVIMKVWDGLTIDEVQSVFHNWISRLAWAIKNGGGIIE
jgi:hypothetical protein